MRVAFLTPELPWPADRGGKLRSFHLLKGLAGVAEVEILTLFFELQPDAGEVRDLCQEIHLAQLPSRLDWRARIVSLLSAQPRSVQFLHTSASWAKLHQVLSQSHFDLLVCDEIGMVPYVPTGAEFSKKLIMRQKIDHLHYAEMAQARRWGMQKLLDWMEARRLARYEGEWMPRFDAAVVCSQGDARVVEQQGSRATYVIENGADFDFFAPDRRPNPTPTILLLGSMDYYPNLDMVSHFFGSMVLPLLARFPQLQILIVGHNPPEEISRWARQPGVTVTGSVPDVRPYMAQSWLLAVPLRLGGGTRLKIVEAMAAKLPVVSTAIGAQGLAVQHGEHLLLADTPADFVEHVATLLGDEVQRRRLAENARRFARDRYSWRVLGERFAEICVETVRGGHS